MSASMAPQGTRERSRRSAHREYHWLAFFATIAFLGIAALSFLVPRALRAQVPGLDVEGSLLARARAMANNTIPYVFMG